MGMHQSRWFRGRTVVLAFTVAGTLALTGCDGVDNPSPGTESPAQATAPSTPASSPPATPHDAASSTAGTSPGSSGSPLPDDWMPEEPTVLATGQKVPDDYEPATLDHPARNVPRPVMPELATQETEAGAQAFLNYRADAQWYSIQTGDTSLIREVTSTDCAECTKQYDAYESIYARDHWAAGGFETQKILPGSFIRRPDGGYNLPVEVKSSGSVAISDKKIPRRQTPFDERDRFDTYIFFERGSWFYLTGSPRGSL